MKLVLGSLLFLCHAHLAIADVSPSTTTVPAAIAVGELAVGQVPSEIQLSDKTGGLVEGNGPWSSISMHGKVAVLFYVAPEHKDLNQHVSKALKEAHFAEEKFQSYAVVNMAASSWPNFMIESKLKASQKEFPRTQYVKDKERILVNQWKLQDDSNNVVAFDKNGTVLFLVKGKVTSEQVAQLLELVRSHL